MTTMLDEWVNFKAKVYPDGMTAEQEKQLRQAFFVGAGCYLVQLGRASYTPDEAVAVASMMALSHEVEKELAAFSANCKARN
jgi:hypothetical protein